MKNWNEIKFKKRMVQIFKEKLIEKMSCFCSTNQAINQVNNPSIQFVLWIEFNSSIQFQSIHGVNYAPDYPAQTITQPIIINERFPPSPLLVPSPRPLLPRVKKPLGLQSM